MKRMAKLISLVLMLSLLITSPALADLKRGDSGDDVFDLQSMLLECGWLFELPDGSFGKKTESAVKAYEEYRGLTVDGIADDEMMTLLAQDWQRLMGYGDDYGDIDSSETAYPFFCNQWSMSEASSETDYCQTHAEKHLQAMSLLASGEEDDAQGAFTLWQDEIDTLYDKWMEQTTESGRAPIIAAKALYMSGISSQRAAIESYYSEFQIQPARAQVYSALEISMRNHAAWLCAMISGSLTDGSEGAESD